MIQFKVQKTPLYLQVKQYIKRNIDEKKWTIGYKLPTERELAKTLDVSRKTVSLAYKELEKEGIITSRQGRGTFVINRHQTQKDSQVDRLIENIDYCIQTSVKIGIEPEEFLDLCRTRINRYTQELKKVKLVFIECNREQLDYFSKELELGAGVSITPILLQDLKKNIEDINKKIQSYDFIITTFFHIEEVKTLIKDKNKEILPVALNPQLESIIKIARINRSNNIGILSISQNFAEKVKNAIFEAGLYFDNIKIETSTDSDEIKKFVQSLDVIIVSPGRKKEVLSFKDDKDIIEFIFVPDMGSINLLKSVILKKH
jgi:GntR family transcriptional regulator